MVAWKDLSLSCVEHEHCLPYQTCIHFRVGGSCFIGNARTVSTVVKNHGGPTVVTLFPSRLRLLRDYLLSMEFRHQAYSTVYMRASGQNSRKTQAPAGLKGPEYAVCLYFRAILLYDGQKCSMLTEIIHSRTKLLYPTSSRATSKQHPLLVRRGQ